MCKLSVPSAIRILNAPRFEGISQVPTKAAPTLGQLLLWGGVAGLAAYHTEVGLTYAATGRNKWSMEGAVGSFVLGGALTAGGYYAARAISQLLGPRLLSRYPSSGETYSIWSYRGYTVRVSSGHGMLLPKQAMSHAFSGTGLTVNQVERAIARDMVRQVRAGNLAYGSKGVPFDITIGGYTLTYEATYLAKGFFVRTYYIP